MIRPDAARGTSPLPRSRPAGGTLPLVERVARRREASAALRAARPSKLDLPYAATAECRWDLFPAIEPSAPCLVLLNGGGWEADGRPQAGAVAHGVMAHGWSAALPGHTPAPQASLARIVRQGQRALDWLMAQGPQHGISGPVLVCGWGSGAHLAALLLEHPRVVAGLGLSGLYDLTAMGDPRLEETLQLDGLEMAVLSPQHRPVVRKPFAIAYGEEEPAAARRQSRAFHARRRAEGGVGPLLALPGTDQEGLLDSLCAPDGLLCHTAQVLIEESAR
ncbi:alpha/beta hydrolase [Pseudoroseomonas sp. WGS1072]|uniref:alpha/beta hydrolase n=1 Tax=Roseomonas sp. WGS1072 TaxID=3366816 RepID=UPI003BF26802